MYYLTIEELLRNQSKILRLAKACLAQTLRYHQGQHQLFQDCYAMSKTDFSLNALCILCLMLAP
ncbi:MAG TPA: hypothetical protein PLP17_02980, partial [Oligoflexia bacterium]|nr:hypothetical protein [Oligoflexia bacterium]